MDVPGTCRVYTADPTWPGVTIFHPDTVLACSIALVGVLAGALAFLRQSSALHRPLILSCTILTKIIAPI